MLADARQACHFAKDFDERIDPKKKRGSSRAYGSEYNQRFHNSIVIFIYIYIDLSSSSVYVEMLIV